LKPHPSKLKSRAHQKAFDKGLLAWLDDLPRPRCPYKDVCFAKAWRAGWDHGEYLQWNLIQAFAKESRKKS